MEEIDYGMPKMRAWEDGEEVIVYVYVPGVDDGNIELDIDGDFLEVCVNADVEVKNNDVERPWRDWENSSFRETVLLPCVVVPVFIYHSYDGEVLEVRLKKA